ncbi:MAG: class I SAM-dependent methyltransferase [Bdellovibrionota bacterium]|nr:MAG: class I SAM-dependent methyltransferase [Bdellovibrionota bacterium]
MQLGDATNVPFDDATFDIALSINVGPLLSVQQLKQHVHHAARILRQGGKAIFGIPDSFSTLFTSGIPTTNARQSLEKAAASLSNPSDKEMAECLSPLDSIYRATLVSGGAHVSVVLSENQLRPGQKIWRKLPGIVVPNIYHPVQEYEELLRGSGLTLSEKIRPHFASHEEWKSYNGTNADRTLGEEYVKHSPYCILTAVKEAA